ncbi:MAG: HAD hydrolase-like protein [Cyanobacteria bacterium P01_A01_bin.114]
MTYLIFDFDGTIANTLDVIVDITNRLAPDYGFSPTTPDKLQHFRSLSTQQLLEEAEIPLFRVPFLLRRVRRELRKEVHLLEPIPQLTRVIHELAAQDHQLMIASSNSPHNIHHFLAQHGLEKAFSHVHANIGLLGKTRILKRIQHRNSLHPAQMLYVGDETRDIEAAQRANIQIAAVSWGFSSRAALQRQQPSFLLDKPAELLRVATRLDCDLMATTRQPTAS